MRLLHIDTSILGDRSVSRELTAAIVEKLRETGTDIDVIYHDLAAENPPHLTLATLPGDHPWSAMAGPLDTAAQALRDDSQRVLEEFLAADTVVLGVPMYNFTIPTQLKAWIDRIVVPGKTFAWGANGPEGLAGNKRVIVAIARGGFYGRETGAVSAEHAESYMRTALGFIGLTSPEIIIAEGIAAGDESKAKAIAVARDAVRQLAV
jgi:FMN-dependent NADH-azoreductase